MVTPIIVKVVVPGSFHSPSLSFMQVLILSKKGSEDYTWAKRLSIPRNADSN